MASDSPLNPFRFDDFTLPEPEFWDIDQLIEADWLPEPKGILGGHVLLPGTFAVLSGPEGIGKTWLAMKLAECITWGDDFCGLKTEQSKVTLISEEMTSAEMRMRCLSFNRRPGINKWDLGFQKNLELHRWEGRRKLQEILEKRSYPQLLIIDALPNCIKGPVGSGEYLGPILDSIIRDICRQYNLCILFIHHMVKGNEWNKNTSDQLGWAKILSYYASDIMIVSNNKSGKFFKFDKVRHGYKYHGMSYSLVQQHNGKQDIIFKRYHYDEPKEDVSNE